MKLKLGVNEEINLVEGISGNYSVDGPITISPLVYTDGGKRRLRSNQPLLEGDAPLRTMKWTEIIRGVDQDTLRSKTADLREQLMKPINVITFNSGGVVEQDVKFVVFCTSPVPDITDKALNLHKYPVPIELEMLPFTHGAQIDLPPNRIKDADLWHDYGLDGIANSFSTHSSGSGPAGTRYIEGAYIGADNDGYQRITMSAGASGAEYGIKSAAAFSVTAGEPVSHNIVYKTGTLTQCKAYIYIQYNDGGATKHVLVDDATVKSTDTEGPQEDLTVPTGATTATLYIALKSTGASPVGTLYVKKALDIAQASIPTGLYGRRMWWTTYSAENPCLVQVDNVPGDVPALTRFSVRKTLTSEKANRVMLGHRIMAKGSGLNLVCKRFEAGTPPGFYETPSSESGCLGGTFHRCASGGAGSGITSVNCLFPMRQDSNLPSDWADRFLPTVKFRRQGANPSQVMVRWSATQGQIYKTGDWVTLADSNDWQVLVLTPVLTLPLMMRPAGASAAPISLRLDISSPDLTQNHDIDFLEMMLSSRQVYARGGEKTVQLSYGNTYLAMQYGGFTSDTITGSLPSDDTEPDSGPYLFHQFTGTYGDVEPEVTWPPDKSKQVPWDHDWNGPLVRLNRGYNEMLAHIYTTSAPGSIYDLQTSISIVPRYAFQH